MSINPDTIILAEDSPSNRKIITHLLEKMGFHVVPCEHGQEALTALTSGQHKNVKLVISDIMMPTMDGLELLKQIRESETYRHLPVILVTAISEKEYIDRARQLQADGYILKPVTVQRVFEKMKQLFPEKTFPKLAG